MVGCILRQYHHTSFDCMHASHQSYSYFHLHLKFCVSFLAQPLIFWLWQKVRVTWLIKIQVKIIFFRFSLSLPSLHSFHFVSGIGFVCQPTTPSIITLWAAQRLHKIYFTFLDKFARLISFFVHSYSEFLVGTLKIKSLFIYARRKSFWLKLSCSARKAFFNDWCPCAHTKNRPIKIIIFGDWQWR